MVSDSENVVALLIKWAKSPGMTGGREKIAGAWQDRSWDRIAEEVRALSEALVEKGIKPGDRVAIFAATSLRWVICDLAISASNAVTVPLYGSDTSEECRFILNDSQSILAFVDDDLSDGKQIGRLSRIRETLSECPSLREVVIFSGDPQGSSERSYSEFLEGGRRANAVNPQFFETRVGRIRPDDAACFIYTSGTTGNPKGVILTHSNWAYEAAAVAKLDVVRSTDSIFLFLPLAHSFAQVLKATWLVTGAQMVFAESPDKLMVNLLETQPTVLPAVPRVFEKVFAAVVESAQGAPGIKGRLGKWAFRLFDEYVEAQGQNRNAFSFQFEVAKKLVFTKIARALSEKLGGNLRVFISGGAPLSTKIAYFFSLLDFKVLEGYGLSETSGGTTVNIPSKIKIGTVGPPLPGTEIRIAEDGEILIRGGGVMKGYFNNPQATSEAFESPGWFKTGDIGELDSEGYLKITDRKKDIIVTAGGKKFSPQNLEGQFKAFPLISQALVHGDKEKYLVALLTVNEGPARKLIEAAHQQSSSYAELTRHPAVIGEIQAAVNAFNARQPPYGTVKKFALLTRDFSQEEGEMTPSAKMKRKLITAKYRSEIQALYN